ncbi:MAG: GlsB/YeaQ/YmgE family stress response membrane protein [Burkholderiales bacterium]|nr:GlsB/YeaQ/YmgE family stress response membrane protein [Burkholderiales bacterium]
MGLLIAAVVGLVIGVIAKLLMPGKDPGGWLMTIVLGIAGSWVGSFLLAALGIGGTVPALIGAVLGAMLLLALYRLIKKS